MDWVDELGESQSLASYVVGLFQMRLHVEHTSFNHVLCNKPTHSLSTLFLVRYLSQTWQYIDDLSSLLLIWSTNYLQIPPPATFSVMIYFHVFENLWKYIWAFISND